MKLPVIRIRYGRLLDPMYRELCRFHPKYKSGRYPSAGTIATRVRQYQRAWERHEERLLTGMCRASGLRFSERGIDVFVVGKGYHPFSYPLVIPGAYRPDRFVNVLSHELIHHLLSDNTKNINLLPRADRFAQYENHVVRVHVLVHAIHQYVFLDVLGSKERLDDELKWARHHRDYAKAWQIVQQCGYKTIVNEIRAQVQKAT